MPKIIEVALQPGTQGEINYNLNSIAVYQPGKTIDEMPKVTEIELYTDEHGNTSVSVWANNELYRMYENVPYSVTYETSFNKLGDSN